MTAGPARAAVASPGDTLVRATNLTKVYRLYRTASYRFRDMFGLLGHTPGAFTEHIAIDDLSLDIRRGEKVAVIGRNGAGKSTFLKLVTGVVQPTSGALDVKGKVHALLQIGTGFHPDFTGRENVYAYFAQLGISGAEAGRLFEEVVDFAEIEEYIDQPIKTYSTGMAVRLMFSTSTAITPDLLVLDEVLGVGDAYFAHKSFARMRDLTEAAGSTLLLVTHDIYSAVNLCERVIWLDRGRVLIDGDGPTVVKAYEDSVRQQEESRLRVRKQQKLVSAARLIGSSGAGHLLIEIHSRGNRPQACPVYFSAIELVDGDRLIDALPLASRSFDQLEASHLQKDACCWGDATVWDGRETRPFLNYGSSFHKVAGVFLVPSGATPLNALSVRLTYWAAQPCALVARLFVNGRGVTLGSLPPAAGAWTTHEFALNDPDECDAPVVNFDGVQGSGAIVVDDVRMVDERGEEILLARHGHPAHFELEYHIADPNLCERAQFVLVFHRDGVQIASRIITRDLLFDAQEQPRGRVHLRIPNLRLADGEYAVSVFVAREGYFDEQQTMFYSLNPGVYYSLNRILGITVVGGGLIATGAVFVDDGEWSLQARSPSR